MRIMKRGSNGWVSAITLLIMVFILAYCIISFYPRKYSDVIEENAKKYGLEPSLIYAVIKTESGYDEKAQSYKGAKGLMQIMDETGKWGFLELGLEEDFSPELLYNPEKNIELGCWYLSKLIKQFDGVDIALAAYNAGSGNVSSWMKNPDYFDGESLYYIPFAETRNYLKRVKSNKKIYEAIRGVKSNINY